MHAIRAQAGSRDTGAEELCLLSEKHEILACLQEIRSGALSLKSIQLVRSIRERFSGIEDPAADFMPEAGTYEEPAYLKPNRRALSAADTIAPTPQHRDEALNTIIKAFGGDLGGLRIERYTRAQHSISAQEAEAIRHHIQETGLEFIKISPRADLAAISAQASMETEFGPTAPLTQVLDELAAQGIVKGFHAAPLLVYETLKGYWITSSIPTRRIARHSHFFMAASLTWNPHDDDGLLEYLERPFDDCWIKGLAPPLSAHASKLANKSVLLEVELAGYRSFSSESKLPLLTYDSWELKHNTTIAAACPPPPAFIRPLAIFE